jgi:membrane protein
MVTTEGRAEQTDDGRPGATGGSRIQQQTTDGRAQRTGDPAKQTDDGQDDSRAEQVPGGEAQRPTEIPPKGWFQVVKRGWKEAKIDQVPLLSAGVAYYAFLALFPALIAIVSIYGLIANPGTIAAHIASMGKALPGAARQLITDQVTALASKRATLGFSAILAIVIALFSASGGMSNLITAVNIAYDEEEKRNFLKKRLLALVLTLGAIIFMVIMLGLVAVLPPLLKGFLGNGVLRWVLQIIGYLVLFALVAAALAILYRLAPDRDGAQLRWVSVGALVATTIWLVASIGFSVYTSTLGNYAKTYGVFAGVVILLFWLWLTSYAILLGAEINAEAEGQTVADTTKGQEEPLGQRGAVKADTLPPDEPEKPDKDRKATDSA